MSDTTPLTAAERALFFGRDRANYLAKNPTARRGTVGNGRPRIVTDAESYTCYAIVEHEVSKRTIAKHCSRYSFLGEEVLLACVGTSCDNGTVLDRLRLIPEEDRMNYIKNKAVRIRGHRRTPYLNILFEENAL